MVARHTRRESRPGNLQAGQDARYRHAALVAGEPERLEALHRMGLLDSVASPTAKQLTAVVAGIFRVPTVLISLVDRDRQYFWCAFGLSVQETHRDESFCAHALHAPEILVVLDALADPRFAANPLVLGPPRIRFYAGTPIHSRDGYRLGTLCLLGDKPRSSFSVRSRKLLQQCASLASLLLATEAERNAVTDGRSYPADRNTSERETSPKSDRKRSITKQGQHAL